MSSDRRVARHAGFTLTELLVAVGTVALLTVGVGQIFRSVGRLTSQSQALAETDQLARQIERQLRSDIEAYQRMAPDETFLVIRMREVGDIDRNGQENLTLGERRIYINREDQDADTLDGIPPYWSNQATGVRLPSRSRAVTTRVDDVAFLGRAPKGEPYRSAQTALNVQNSNDPLTAAPTAETARLYWGHALRPRAVRDSARDANPLTAGTVNPSWPWSADGDFGSWAAGSQTGQNAAETINNPMSARFNVQPAQIVSAGRNQYAGEWILARHALLLVGGEAAGVYDPATNTLAYPTGAERTYAPYITDLDNRRRFALEVNRYLPTSADPRAAMIMHGRTDICAQSAVDVRRWLEGEEPARPDTSGPGRGDLRPPFAGAFLSGPYSDQALFSSPGTFFQQAVGVSGIGDANKPLWQRVRPLAGTFNADLDANRRFLRTAVASTIGRIQQESAPTPIWRMVTPAGGVPIAPPEQALMDTHAAFASRCSRFEVAWSNGARATADIVRPGSSPPETLYRAGDLIFFDISPLSDTTGGVAVTLRNTYDTWLTAGQLAQARQRVAGLTPRPTANNPYTDDSPRAEYPRGLLAVPGGVQGPPNILMSATGGIDPTQALPLYDTAVSGGDALTSPNPNELLAVWPFRLPTPDGGYGKAWPKPTHLRVRFTLHDAQYRLQERLPDGTTRSGRTYEVILALTSGQSS